MESIPRASWRFHGVVGERIAAVERNWLLRMPAANPGLLEMFRRRDRHLPYAEPVPWAGEFAGKYLISAVQACRMTTSRDLEPFVASFVQDLLTCQAEDGYLGPWPRQERLLGHWDLWGHYHCMLGLLMWHDRTRDQAAFDAVIQAADLICRTYADGDRRPLDAGTPQINLAVLHVMADLVARTGNGRCRMLMQRIEEDMEQDGDWLRLGARGVPYHRLPDGGTRWESLHIVQGLAQCWRLSGKPRYRDAAVSLWTSIRDFDRHPSGAFSTHEKACGSPYEIGAIETCCSIAWLALSIDVLRLTGDPTVADELELTTFNQILASLHPSGSWCTYDTPINGVRAPSYHQISFQYRPGTPELNCCSVNAPRGLGMLAEWAVMQADNTLFVNAYAPGAVTWEHPGAGTMAVTQDTSYPIDGRIRITLHCSRPADFVLNLRIPAWTARAHVRVNDTHTLPATPGTYLSLDRTWRTGDTVDLDVDMTPRVWLGREARHGTAAVYHGPLLLAADSYCNDQELSALPPIDPGRADLQPLTANRTGADTTRHPPWGLWALPAGEDSVVTLCDFASAGVHGTEYAAWLPARVPPPPARLTLPDDGTRGRPGPVLLRWFSKAPRECTFTLTLARNPELTAVVARHEDLRQDYLVANDLPPGTYWWEVQSIGPFGTAASAAGPLRFVIDPAADQPLPAPDKNGLLIADPLAGRSNPRKGHCRQATHIPPAVGPDGRENTAVRLDGTSSGLLYDIPFFPGRNCTFCAWVCPDELPTSGMQQVFSAWCAPMDDPLRVTIEGNSLSARIEAGRFYRTPPAPLTPGTWHHVAAVKSGPLLTLYVDGRPVGEAAVPDVVRSSTEMVGVGVNPLYEGGERLRGRLAEVGFYCTALDAATIAGLARTGTSQHRRAQ